MVFSRSSQKKVFRKKKRSEILSKLKGKHLCRSFLSGCKPATLLKNIFMDKRFSLNGWEHLRTAASDFGKYLTTLTILFDSVENIRNIGL